jgi:hypothetical protein
LDELIMVARPGKLQAVFNAGELGPRFDQRTQLKYYAAGLQHADRIELLSQGGFTLAAGLRHVGDTADTAGRLIPFAANNGNVYDLVLTASHVEVWGEVAKLYQFLHVYSAGQIAEVLYSQDSDTLLTFHEDVAPWRMLHGGPTTWVTGAAPLTDIPNYDYGAVYTNGLASEFILEFIGFHEGSAPYWDNIVFTLTVNGEETTGIRGESTMPTAGTTPVMATLAANVEAAILALPNVQPGITVTIESAVNPYRLRVIFGGSDNLGDVWSLSGRVTNKSDAAILTAKEIVGVTPGEPIISVARGWPRCGVFYQLRLILGGLKSLPNAWMASIGGRFYDFDTRLNAADGSFVIPLNIPGGERIENIVNNQFLLVMTSERNYWVAGSASGLSKTAPPKHVPATDHGVASAVPVVDNEGSAVYVHKSGDFIGEMRYTDIDGNYTATDLSLLAYQLIDNVIDLAMRRKTGGQSANQCLVVNEAGVIRIGYLLREQDLTGFVRYSTPGKALACSVNNRNEASLIMERDRGAGTARSFERLETGLLLDGAIDFINAVPINVVSGLAIHEGQVVWALGDGHVMGPFTVLGGEIELPIAAMAITVGRWTPPKVVTLPLSRMIGPDLWLQKKGRIHTVQIFVEDTTSLAISCNGGKIFDVNLRRFGMASDVPELLAPVTGLIKIPNFGGFVDEPTCTITQVRPGRLTVKSIVLEAQI